MVDLKPCIIDLVIEVTEKQNILVQLALWYLVELSQNILRAWKNLLVFGFEYFSVSTILKTFFSYWHRYKWSYGRGFDLKTYFEALTFNLISRCLGAMVKSFFIVLWAIFESLIFIIGLVIFLSWFFLFPLLFYGFISGLGFLF